MHRILVGIDSSPDSRTAVRWAAALAAPTGAELVVANAWTPRFSELPPEEHDGLATEAQAALDEWAAAAVEPGTVTRRVALEGDPRDQLLRAADDLDADLLVIGAKGTGRRGHTLHLGSVAHHLVHETTRPLAVIPVTARAAWPAPIVVGVDGSAHSDRALEWAIELAGPLDSEVVAVYAEAPPAEFVSHNDPKSWFQRAHRDLDEWIAQQQGPEPSIRAVVVDHEPGPGLAEAGDHEEAGLIVVGARGIGGVTGIRLGGTALKVLHHAHTPVIIVP